jgi:hypothetical protein
MDRGLSGFDEESAGFLIHEFHHAAHATHSPFATGQTRQVRLESGHLSFRRNLRFG